MPFRAQSQALSATPDLCYIVHMLPSTVLQEAARKALADSAMGARRFETAHGLRKWSLRGLLDRTRPKVPSIDRAAEICDALGLELYVGPPRESDTETEEAGGARLPPPALRSLEASARTLNRVVADAGGDPIPDDLWPVLAVRRGGGVQVADNENLPPGARPVDVVELAAAAGGGAEALGEEIAGRVWFRQDWLDRQGLDPTQCVVIGVSGESMEPLLCEGDSILVDRKRRRRLQDRIFVVRTDDGLVVKRAGRDDDGGWLLVSEHPSWAPAPWPADAETIGQAVWTARSLM